METEIKKILEIAINAPSGDNAQPWKFVVKHQEVYIYNLPEKDATLYNFRNRGDFIGHGALLENISLIAKHEGLTSQITLFPNVADRNLIAIVKFEKSLNEPSQLYPHIKERATNRKPYKITPLSREQIQAIINASQEVSRVELIFIEDRNKIIELGNILSLNERLVLENYYIHQGLFSYIRWTKEEELQHQTGLYIKTLELKPPQESAFKLFRKWRVINFLNKLGISKLVAKDTAKLYASSAAFGLLVTQGSSDEDFIATGKVLQKIWLTATSLGLSIQPTAALLYLAQRISSGETEKFSKAHIEMILEADKNIRALFNITSKQPTMLFRIGTGDAPSHRSIKSSPFIE